MENITPKKWGNDRATGIIIREGKILLIHRFKDGNEYWVLPGGTQEENETVEQTLDRELAEELSLKVLSKKLVFSIETPDRVDHHFLITEFEGEPKMGGPELERMNERNVYKLEKVDVQDLDSLKILPPEATVKLKNFLSSR